MSGSAGSCLLMAQVGVAGSARIGDRRDPGGTGRGRRPPQHRRRRPDRGAVGSVGHDSRPARTTAATRRDPTASGCAPTPCCTGWPRSPRNWRPSFANGRPMPRRTIATRGLDSSGIGLHTGVTTTVTFRPAPSGQRHRVPSDATCRRAGDPRPGRGGRGDRAPDRHRPRRRRPSTPSSTCWRRSSPSDIDDLVIELDGPEPPILDGSFLPWLDLLAEARAGRARRASRPCIEVPAPFTVVEGDSTYVVAPARALRITATIEWDHPLIGRQAGHLRHQPRGFPARAGARRAPSASPAKWRPSRPRDSSRAPRPRRPWPSTTPA